MLAVSPLSCSNGAAAAIADDGAFSVVPGGDSFSDINFDDLFVGFGDGDVLPDLEVDPDEMFADFSFSGGEEDSGNSGAPAAAEACSGAGLERPSPPPESEEREVVSARSAVDRADDGAAKAASPEAGRGRKPSSGGPAKGSTSQGKRKVKVDWTPELHRRFVQAVEQLGVDKAVPSRILELMGIDCLTRHNIASHLQKYRSHRKHLLAREAEAASWSQRRQMYSGSGGGGGGSKRDNMNHPWLAPTLGFPPPPPPPPPIQPAAFRPLHVWGHPTVVDQPPLVPLWPRPPPRSLSLPWALPRPHVGPPPDPSLWHPHFQRNALTPGMPCFPHQPVPPTARFSAPPVPGIPPHAMYRPPAAAVAPSAAPAAAPPASSGKHSPSGPMQLQLSGAHPSNESIDAALGDVLAKPWLPLPLGLKPPSLESVMVELQKQGVSKVPPTCG